MSQNLLFIGRFQPFHKGHEKIVARLLRQYTYITIAIGSAQKKRTRDNPFSARERKEMIMRVARAHAGWEKRIKFAFLRDNPSNAKWVRTMRVRFPSSSFAIASANPLVRKLLGKAGYAIDPSPLFRRAEWEGKKIRAEVRAGKDISTRLPLALRIWMKEKGGKIIVSSR